MKANHNASSATIGLKSVVVNINSSKDESKSQLLNLDQLPCLVVVNINSSKDESKSQPGSDGILIQIGCCKYQ